MKSEAQKKRHRRRYTVRVIAEVRTSLSPDELEKCLVLSLFGVESEAKISDGDDERFEVVDYGVTEAVPIKAKKDEDE